MDLIRFIILGIVQGLTEFLPVSSSGHLVIFQQVLPDFDQPGIVLEVILHAGTLLSVLYYFRSSILKKSFNYWILIGFATIPAVLVGLLFNDIVESLFESVKLVGVALIVTGIINYLTNKISIKGKNIKTSKRLNISDFLNPLLIGISQAFAIMPGISRSGSTIFAGRKLGLSKRSAAEYSFLLSIPAILGANVYELISNSVAENGFNYLYIAGFLSAFVSGVFAIKLVINFLEKANFKYFSYYALIVGILIVLIY